MDDDLVTKLALTWPAKGSAHNSDWLLEPEPDESKKREDRARRRTCESRLTTLRYLIPGSLADWLQRRFSEVRPLPLCPYHDILPARALLGLATAYNMPNGVNHLIQERIVLIGATFIGHGDRQIAPLHGELSGVHVHAMALDNLLTQGKRWRRAGSFHPLDWTRAGNWFAFSSVLLIVLAWEANQRINRRVRRLERALAPSAEFTTDKWFRPVWQRMPRALRFCQDAVLMMLTFGMLPTRRRGRLSVGNVVAFWALKAILWLLTMALIFTLANEVMRVGPLSQVEYVLAPLAIGFIDQGHWLVRRLYLLWAAASNARPEQVIRTYRDTRPTDEAP